MINHFKSRIFLHVILFIFSVLFLINQVSAVEVKVIPSNVSVIQGEKFDLNISVDPSGEAIAGAQLKIEFDNSLIVNDVREWNFFKQSGSNTLFNKEIINNSLTTTINVYGAILGPFNVSTPDAFVVINVTSRNLTGKVFVNLSDVKICDPSGNYVAIEVFNGSLNIMEISPYNASQSLFLNGTVVDSITRAGISGVTVFSNTSGSTTTDASGYYALAVTEETHDLTYMFDPIYYTNINTASITSSSVMIPDIELIKKPTGTITGMVSND